jgi:Protein of unknown function (DUF1592)/Protein of unknown function (DUF1588)/Protein of unknown function (DUF1585)/Protein of unknown function (DUF1587)/Protein of unknown function (DUF1595)/Planctomycete cytochrome C
VKVASLIAGTLTIAAMTAVSASSRSQPEAPPSPRVLLDRYCVTCHNQRMHTAGLALDTASLDDVGASAELWELVIRKIRSGAMPPPGRPRPHRLDSTAFVSHLEASLDRVAAASPDPGRTEAVHRLNRFEYRNAIRDLLGLEIEAASLLPADESGSNGFDNMGAVLSTSPALLERYVAAARTVARLAVGRPARGPISEIFRASQKVERRQLSEDLPFGSSGGLAIRRHFPVDGEYLIKIRLQMTSHEYIVGIGAPHRMEIRLDGVRLKEFTVGGEAKGRTAPLSYSGEPSVLGDLEWEAYARTADAGLEIRVPVKAGMRDVAVSFLREQWAPEGILQPRQAGFALNINERPDENPSVDSVTITGPYEVRAEAPAHASKVLTCGPRVKNEDDCARTLLGDLARRAYRRAATEADVSTLFSFFTTGRRDGDFQSGMQMALERLLASPDFLFRIERDPPTAAPGSVYRISNIELASRLSFFLWSSVPDAELLGHAIDGTLSDPATLERQVRRLLADRRASASLVGNFAGQWLLLRNLQALTPDPVAYPDFDEELRAAFQRETELFLETALREDRSIVDLISAEYTFVNERLARHYGIPNVYGDRFRRVTITDEQRGGLLGHGSLLTVTSYPNRTSPVLRGKWLLDNVLGTPPSAPPPNVPTLPERGGGGKRASVRERLEEHRKNPVCASCHAPMDPLGFALENFDAIGAWRTRDVNVPIEATGVLPTGETFRTPADLRANLLAGHREQFVRTVTEKLLTYALGREIDYYDQPAIRRITRDAAATDYRWSSIIVGIIKSPPFQLRRADK